MLDRWLARPPIAAGALLLVLVVLPGLAHLID